MKINIKTWLLLGVIVLGILLRLRNFDLPPIDAHPMRQTDTECVAYFMAKGVGSLLYPKACLIRPTSNESGYFFLEFPLYQGLLAISYILSNFQIWGPRVVNLGLYLIAVICGYGWVSKWFNKQIGLTASFLFSVAPASIFFLGHAVHPDVMAVAMMNLSVLLFILSYEKNIRWLYVAGAVVAAVGIATRPFNLIAWPIYGAILYKNKAPLKDYLFIGFIGVGLYGLWRWWGDSIGVDSSWENWVLAGREKLFDFQYLKLLIWRNVIGEVIGKSIFVMGLIGGVAMMRRMDKRKWPIFGWLLMVPVYWLLVPNGNIIHQYYADIYIFPIVVVAAFGLNEITKRNRLIAVVVVAVVIYNGWRVSGYYFGDIKDTIDLKIAEEIKQNISEGERLLYLYRANSIPISLAHRQGWIVGEWPTDVGSFAWSVVEMRGIADYVVLPKSGYPGVEGEELKVVLQNLELVSEGMVTKTYRWK